MRLLLISNSTNSGEEFLGHPKQKIKEFLGTASVKALFIPWAAITVSYDEYESRVIEKFREAGHDIISIHHFKDHIEAVRNAEAIVVGGGNTWMLLRLLQQYGLIDPVREKILGGTPYIGWSAGANVACPTIRTTNDMAVAEPSSFRAFNLVPFQINPHYIDINPAGHAGETREQRILEFIEINPDIWVAGLREGSMFLIEDKSISLLGPVKARIFRKNNVPMELSQKDDFSFLLK